MTIMLVYIINQLYWKGVVGVASAGPDFYVIALADSSVQHGALVGRLKTLGSHVKESLSQLDG